MVFGVMLIELEVAAGHGPVRTFLRAAFNVARNPLPVSIALGIVASWIGVPIPVPVEKWLDLMGAAAAPCALFAIGLFLSDKSIKSGLAEAGLATLIKLLLQPLAALLILPFFVPIDSIAGKVALLMASLPTAANAFVLAKQFNISVEQNTASVLLTTAFSVVTVSALLVCAARDLTTTRGESRCLQEFKKFAMRGNVVDLAIGVIIGAGLQQDHRLAGRRHHHADHRPASPAGSTSPTTSSA